LSDITERGAAPSRRLVLVRHAKAGHAHADIERPLADQGRADAAAIGRLFAELDIDPGRAVVSPARRARETWELAAAGLPGRSQVETDDRIYANDAQLLLDIVRDTDRSVMTLVLVGHNPSMHEAVMTLDDGRGEPDVRARLAGGLPTGSVAVLEVADWPAVAAGAATLLHQSAPRG
jgi:phosphohistidine phosphatase